MSNQIGQQEKQGWLIYMTTEWGKDILGLNIFHKTKKH